MGTILWTLLSSCIEDPCPYGGRCCGGAESPLAQPPGGAEGAGQTSGRKPEAAGGPQKPEAMNSGPKNDPTNMGCFVEYMVYDGLEVIKSKPKATT